MYDLPPQHLETHYEYTLPHEVHASAQGNLFQQFECGITTLAAQIKNQFPKGLKWGDLPRMFKYVLNVVDHIKEVQNQKVAALYVIDRVIDLTDTPFLPDAATDPIFKKLAHSLIGYYFNHVHPMERAVKSSSSHHSAPHSVEPSREVLKRFAVQLKTVFDGKFQPGDITMIVGLTQEFTNKFPGLNLEQRRECVIQVINDFIDMTDTPYVPDSLVDPLMKKIVPSFVNFLVK